MRSGEGEKALFPVSNNKNQSPYREETIHSGLCKCQVQLKKIEFQ